MSHYGKEFFLGGVSLNTKSFELPPSVGYLPHQKIESQCPLITDHILEKKVSLIAFRQMLSKILPDTCILSDTIITYLKKLVGAKFPSTKQQDYQPELYPIIPLNIYGKPWRWGRIPPNNQKFTYFSYQKNPP